MWANFHFLRPEWLYALPLLLIVAFALKRLPKHQADWNGIIAPHLLGTLFPNGEGSRGVSTMVSSLLVCAMLCIIGAAGPVIEKLPQPVFSVNEGHVVVMDMSLSMRSTDVTPDRLTRAKFKAIDLVKHINEGEIGVVAYAGDAFTISPLTEDINTLEALLPSLRPEIMPVKGSDAFLGLQHAADLLKQAGYPNGKIYWVTDGVDSAQSMEIINWINQTSMQINILAIGSQEGAPIKLQNGELLKDASGNIVIPKMRFNSLASIAQQSGGHASEMTADDSDIKIVGGSRNPQPQNDAEQSETMLGGDQWRELGPWLLLVALPFAAYFFRRGLVAVFIVSHLALFGGSKPAYANEQASIADTVSSWFKNADQQGLDAYNKQEFTSAAQSFEDNMWQGASHYRNGDYELALEAYSAVDSAQSWYNRGNALAQLGQLDAASDAYAEALSRQPDYPQASENKKIVEELKEQQEQQNQQDDQNGDGNQDQSQPDSEQQNSGEQGSDDQQQGDNSSSQDQQGQDNQDGSSQNQPADDESNEDNQSQSQSEQNQSQADNNGQQSGAQPEQSDGEFEDNPEQAMPQPSPGEMEKAVENQSSASATMTDEEREKQQQIDALLRRIPNDPAFLLQRKMQLEAQKRARERRPSSKENQW